MTNFDDAYALLVDRYHQTPALNDALEHLVMQMLRSPSFPNPCVSATIYGPASPDSIEIEGHRADGGLVTAQFRDLFRMSLEDLEPLLTLPDQGRFVMLYFVTTAEHGAAAVRSALDGRQPPVQIFDRAALNALPLDWYSLLREEDRLVPPLPLPPRGSLDQVRQHIQLAITGIRSVAQEMEGRLDRRELDETEIYELKLLRELAIPTLEELATELDVPRATERVRPLRNQLKRLASVVRNPTVGKLLIELAEELFGL